jgi:hypothetical protein
MEAIFDFITNARHDEPAVAGPAQRLQRATTEMLSALGIAAIWGASAGSVSMRLAAANLYKVPMVVLLSTVSALPLGLLAWSRLAGEKDSVSFLAAQAKAMLAAALVLGACAPLVALYSHTSNLAGPVIAHVSVAAALVTSLVAFARAALRGADPGAWPRRLVVVALAAGVQLAAALQLNVLAAPILPTPTAFRAGIDGLAGVLAPRAP